MSAVSDMKISTKIENNHTIERVSLHRKRHFLFHLNVTPFLLLLPLLLSLNYEYLYNGAGTDTQRVWIMFSLPLLFLGELVSLLATYWSVFIRARFQFSTCSSISDAQYVLIKPHRHKGFVQLCPLTKRKSQNNQDEIFFEYQKRRYAYDPSSQIFRRTKFPYEVPGGPTLGQYRNLVASSSVSRSEYSTEQGVAHARDKYGLNRFDVPMPKFMDLFKEHALAPFFVFQVFCVLLWCLDEYWYYSVFTLIMLFVFESTVVNSRLRNLRQIRQMATKPQLIYVYRAGKWQQVSSIDLLPNDVVSVSRHDPEKPDQVCACDILLMKGKAVTNESLLTGESTPQMKDSISDTYTTEDDKFVLDLKKRDKRHIIFGGTRVLQAWPPNPSPKFIPPPPDRGCIGVVLRTGFETSQGKLLRTILYATERVTANNLEALLFIGFLLIFAVTASAYVMYKGLLDPDRSRYKLFLNCTLIITSVVPPELPMELSLAVNTSLLALSKLGIFCTEPFRIPYAGRVQVCCFDKTGTLTSDKMLLKSIVTSSSQTQNNSTTSWPDNARIVLAGCHSLIELEGKMLGDPMEQAGVAGTDFKFSEEKSGAGDTLISMSSKGAKKVKIMRRFAFDSDIKRMSTISYITFGQHKVLRVLVKGAPEALKPLFSATSVPKDYDDSVRELTRRGGRVIALAQKDLPESASSMIDRLSRDQVESELEFVAFAVFESDIKQRTAETITALRDSSHRVVMITGDNPLTACHVARQLHMIRKPLLVLSHKNDDDQFLSWVDENFNTLGQVTGESFHDTLIVSELAPKYDLCVSGEALSFLLRKRIGKANTEQGGRLMDDWIDVYSRYANVFARVSPDQKEHILTSLKSQGFWTLMCGDGTNDVGALKQAHVGVALIDQLPQHQQNQQKQNTSEPSSRQEALRKLQEHQGSFGEVVDTTATKKKTFRELLEEVRKQQEKEAEGENLVRLGDASIASPFTSRIPNIAATADIIRQGRCTLATTMQMYKILALNCLVSAYSLSVLYLDGVKFGDSQMMLTGFGIAMCFLFISRSKPVEKLSKTRPHTRIFSAYMMTSIMGQFLIHLVTLFLTVQASKLASPPDLQISRSIGTERERSFEPNLLNTVVFIVTSLQTVVTFVNNYCGRPFMESLFENRPLFMILMGLGASCFACATGLVPQLNHTLELVPIDDIGFRSLLVIMLVGNIVAVTFFEQLCSRLFPAEEEENGKFEEN